MKKYRFIKILIFIIIIAGLAGGSALADDGVMFRRNISKTPDGETEKAGIGMMPFYVPAQAADGTLGVPIEYFAADASLVETRDFAKPLVAVYIDGIEAPPEVPGMIVPTGGVSFGERDAFAALSLDDGATWKKYNLSRSADLSSFTLKNGHDYPGDVHNMTMAVAGDTVLAAWLSKYCEGGSPAYSLVDDAGEPLYPDLFGVAGAQGSVDYTQQGHPEVGEIPYSCVWTARGSLELDDETGTYGLTWRKAERLTSGRRDANVLAIGGVSEAGFVLVWQEDPEGLRPGQGLGPGEGWSGAIVNQKTDMWYSVINWSDFDLVQDAEGNPIPIESYEDDTMPKVALPMAVPVRLTDNNMCKYNMQYDNEGNVINPYCYEDFDANGTADFCAAEVGWTNPGGTTLSLCETQDGRVLWGRTGAARTRLNLQPYTKPDGTVSAWVVMAYEELKALGNGGGDVEEDPIDIGKNIWYHTFDMFEPDIVSQGAMLNQPAIDRETDDFFELLEDDFGNYFYETEIARRFNIMTQSASKAEESKEDTTAILIYKQGIINQGGPADIFLRRLVLPDNFDSTVDNPYAFENMVCEEWDYTDGSNPRYVEGLCLDPAINVSGSTIGTCEGGSSGDACADLFPWDGGEGYVKVTEWMQTEDNLDDQAWENPYDVSKGHRGFIDGDFIMMMYAWSPNWKANSVGNDHYNLYIRRSYDGGLTWTTTPSELEGSGTCHTENYLSEAASVESCYGAGEFEQARNVSQLIGNKVTILDPRYTPTTDEIVAPTGEYLSEYDYPAYAGDVRDPSAFFIVYETGDNTTVAEGEAVPLDLFYSRAYYYGDEYDLVDFVKDGETVPGWDWLENQHDDLSGEASVTTNPSGSFFYAVWNQWQEPEEHVIENSDIYFRRILYVDDGAGEQIPMGGILFKSLNYATYVQGGEVTFIGTAKDSDHVGEGVVAYEWSSDIDGILGTEQTFSAPVTSFSLGVHTITFRALDGEGNWSPDVRFKFWVADEFFTTRLPVVLK
jgi:hypothetical protein